MRYRPLGKTGLTVSEIGFGCASWWGKLQFEAAKAVALVHAAIEGGVTFFDTGSSYSGGEAEARLGQALAGRDVSGLVIATKAGTFRHGSRMRRDFSPAAVVASAERSLQALGVEQLGLLQLHGPAASELNDDLLGALESLKARGLVRALGVNSFDPAVIEAVTGIPAFGTVMVDYNVLRPEREPVIARAAAAGKGVLAGMALGMGHIGLRIARVRGPQDVWYAARGLIRHRAEVARGARMGFLNGLDEMTGPQAALAFVLGNPDVSCAVIGTTRMAHLHENLAASGLELPPGVEQRIRSV